MFFVSAKLWLAGGGSCHGDRQPLQAVTEAWRQIGHCLKLAVAEIVGHRAAQVNKAVVLFLEKVEQVNKLVETGFTVNTACNEDHTVKRASAHQR